MNIFSSKVPQKLPFIHHCFTKSPLLVQLAIDCFLILLFILSTSSKESVSAGKKKCKCLSCALFLQGQNGRGVNEWQSVLITRRGYLGLDCLISPNAFQFLMLPNCRLLQAGPFIIAGQHPMKQAHTLQSSVVVYIKGECSLSLSGSVLITLNYVHDLCLCNREVH